MDLRQLEILQAIAETGSFTACGRKLHVSQSAISRQILLLEEELGEPLFLRVGRQVRMTPAAESLVQLGQRVFLDVRETVGAITDRTRELRGTLRLVRRHDRLPVRVPAAAEASAARPPAPRRAADGRDWPGGRCRRFARGRVDAGLLTLPVEESDLVTVPVAARRAAARDDADAPAGEAARRCTARDLAGLPFVLFEVGSATRKVIDQFFADREHRADHRDGHRKRRDHQGDGQDRPRRRHRAVSGGGARGARPASCSARGSKGTSWCARPAGSTPGPTGCRGSIDELLLAFDAIRGKLRLAPRGRGDGVAG